MFYTKRKCVFIHVVARAKRYHKIRIFCKSNEFEHEQDREQYKTRRRKQSSRNSARDQAGRKDAPEMNRTRKQ